MTSGGLAQLSALQQLETLDLDTYETPMDWRLVCRTARRAQREDRLNDGALEALSHLPSLHTLVLGRKDRLTVQGLRHLSRMTALRRLNLAGACQDASVHDLQCCTAYIPKVSY